VAPATPGSMSADGPRRRVPARVGSSDGVQVAVHELGGDGPVLLVGHATGFHGRCYLPMAASLAERYRCVAFDYRGHGDTPMPSGVAVSWERYGDDATAVARAVSAATGAPLVAFGHSMGGACLLMAARREPELFERLVLFEPIVFPPGGVRDPEAGPSPLIAGARRRRASFPTLEEAIANYAAKPPLGAFTPAALDAYVRFGFRRGDDGQFHLCCDPEVEAATFEAGSEHRTWDALEEIEVPVLVVAGRVDADQPSAIAAAVAERLPRGRYLEVPEIDHFGPMVRPDLVAAIVAGAHG